MQPNNVSARCGLRRRRTLNPASHSLRFTQALHERCTKTLRRRLDITMGREAGVSGRQKEGEGSLHRGCLIAISRQ